MKESKTGKPCVKIPDLVIILAALFLTGFSVFSAWIGPRGANRVLIEGADESWVFPLDARETVKVRGPLGITVVRVRDNEAWVESSPCGNQTCVATGHVNSGGAWVACLPNKVFLRVEGSGSDGVPDTIAW